MTEYYDSSIEELMPSFFKKSPEVQAISYAIRAQIRKLCICMIKAQVYVAIDSLDDEILDLLALELGSQYYSEDMDLETKREVIKNTLPWYMKAGTLEAVEELVATVFGTGEVSEWFEYGDEPYYFKITTSATLTDDVADQLLDMIGSVKNTRSHLRKVDIQRDAGDMTAYLAAILQEKSHTTLTNDVEKDEETYVNPNALVAAAGEVYEECEGNFGRAISIQAETEPLSAGTGIGCTQWTRLLGHGINGEIEAEQISAATAIGCAASAVLQ